MDSPDLELTAPVFNVQSYSIHDGPGIRVTVFLKGCPLRCLWCANPESHSAAPQLMTYAGRCTGCGGCVGVCPQRAIRLEETGGKVRAVTDRALCADCGACEAACPNGARELAGRPRTVGEVLEQALRDKLFMDASGGGLTLSGGECLLHPDFSEALLRAAKEQGLHTAAESCCHASREAVDRVFRWTDLGLLDIKHMDPEVHERLTGVRNERILENVRHIYHELRVPVTVRVPVIPGCNDSDENIAATARFAAEALGPDVAVHLLPYHRLGEAKNESLGREAPFTAEPPSDEHMQRLKAIVEAFGLTAQIGG